MVLSRHTLNHEGGAEMRNTLRHVPILVALAVLVSACAQEGNQPAGQDGAVEPAGAAYSCVETYSAETLVRRSFAFDGTVLATEVRTDPRLPEGEGKVPWVTFEVNRWFRGGSVSEVGVWIEVLNTETSAGIIRAVPGTRLLVAGEPRWGGDPLEDPVAWPCGFTQPWTAETADEWQAAFSD